MVASMSSNHWQNLYQNRSNHYDLLVKSEDYQGQLIAALHKLYPIDHKEVVEFGAGTGRITAQLVPQVKQIHAFDLTPAMIWVADRNLKQSSYSNWGLGIADSRAMPVQSGCADIAIEGWSFVQIMTWYKERWQYEVGRAIGEMLRVVRPGGIAILIETLGTGRTTPQPLDLFLPVYDYFESEWHFSSMWIRTDFHFPTLTEAHATIDPVFGEAVLGQAIASEEGVILPECTGIWWRYI